MRRVGPLLVLLCLLGSPVAAEPLQVTVRPIDKFSLTGADEPKPPLTFLGGIDVTSSSELFGGLSGIDMIDADHAFIISDMGVYVQGRLVHANGRLVGFTDAVIGSIFPDGDIEKETGDVEDVALDPSDRTRGVIVRERQAKAMLSFDLTTGRPAHFKPVRLDADVRILTSNKGLESVAYAPSASPLAGDIVTIAERPWAGVGDFPAWVTGIGKFSILRHDGFDVSSARFLPNGDLLILERRYSPAWGLAVRLRRIPGKTITLGARVDGRILLDAGMSDQIDNMEGLAVSEDADGRTILTLVSDDNYSILQRTLILQFALAEK